MLAIEFGDLAGLGFDLSLTGFGDDELAAIMNGCNPGPSEVAAGRPPLRPRARAAERIGDQHHRGGDHRAEQKSRLRKTCRVHGGFVA